LARNESRDIIKKHIEISQLLLERESIISIIRWESVATSMMNPSLKRDTIYRRWPVFIFTQKITTPSRLRKDKRSQENPMIFQTRGNVVRKNLISRGKFFPQIQETPLLYMKIPTKGLNVKLLLFGSMDFGVLWVGQDLMSIKIKV